MAANGEFAIKTKSLPYAAKPSPKGKENEKKKIEEFCWRTFIINCLLRINYKRGNMFYLLNWFFKVFIKLILVSCWCCCVCVFVCLCTLETPAWGWERELWSYKLKLPDFCLCFWLPLMVFSQHDLVKICVFFIFLWKNLFSFELNIYFVRRCGTSEPELEWKLKIPNFRLINGNISSICLCLR